MSSLRTNLRWRLSRPSRLIDALKEHVDQTLSARFLKRALESNVCRVNGKVERFASAVLKAGDVIELSSHWQAGREEKKCTILYEDESLLAIDKPAGLICTDEVFRKELKRSVWLAHRLDKDTTGILLFAKDAKSRDEIQECFEKRTIEKEYLALVDGIPERKEGLIQNCLAKKKVFQGQTIWGSSSQGLSAETSWERLAAGKDASLIRCMPKTGRTHQLRVHLSEMGHPILIDRQYSSQLRCRLFVNRPMLHAWRLKLEWRGKSVRLEAPVPPDFTDALKSVFGNGFQIP